MPEKLVREAQDALTINRNAAYTLARSKGAKQTMAMLERADRDLLLRLRQAEGLSGPGKGSFTAAQLRATMAQVRQVTRDLAKGMKGAILSNAGEAAEASARHTIEYLTRADLAFKGVGVQPLALNEAALMDAAVSGAQASVLRRLASSGEPEEGADDEAHPAKEGILERYGVETVGVFEQTLQNGLITKKPWELVKAELTEASPFLQGKPAYWSERIVRTECLTGDTPVSGAVVLAVYRRWHDGNVVEVVTERGRKFTATPNHPMLTRRAWVEAGGLKEGDDLVCYLGEKHASVSGDEDIADAPTTIGEIFDSLSAVGVGERRRGAYADFHGDGSDGDVDVAYPNGSLKVGAFAAVYKPLAEDVFAPSDFASSTFCERCNRLLSMQQQPCLCGGTWGQPSFAQPSNDRAPGRSKTGGERLDTLPRAIPIGDLIGGEVIATTGMPHGFESIGCGAASGASDPLAPKESLHAVGADAELRGGSLGAHAGEIEFDRIVSVRICEYHGHVFNLSTPHGYFAINGAYTGNTMGAYNRAGWEAIRSADEDLNDMVKILAATFDDRTGSDSFAIHGQIRRPEQAFEWWDGLYQHPPNRPNDRETVVPHRISWPIPAFLKWKTSEEVRRRWDAEHGPKSKAELPDRPEMTTVPLSQFGREAPPAVEQKERARGEDG